MSGAAIAAAAVALVLGLAVAPGAQADAGPEANRAIVRQFTDEVYNQQQRDKIVAFVHPDFVDHSPGAPPDAHGPAHVLRQYDSTFGAFPNLKFTIDDVIAEGDKVVMRWSSNGKFTGTLGDVRGLGQDMQVQGISIFRMQDGKIIESWDLVDRLAMLKQAGFKVTPPKPAREVESTESKSGK